MSEVKKKILFVCSANKDRSKTAEDYFSSVADAYCFESAGTNQKTCHKEGTNPLNEALVAWADLIYVMENKHKKWIEDHIKLKSRAKIIVLNIPDVYKYYEPALIAVLETKMSSYL